MENSLIKYFSLFRRHFPGDKACCLNNQAPDFKARFITGFILSLDAKPYIFGNFRHARQNQYGQAAKIIFRPLGESVEHGPFAQQWRGLGTDFVIFFTLTAMRSKYYSSLPAYPTPSDFQQTCGFCGCVFRVDITWRTSYSYKLTRDVQIYDCPECQRHFQIKTSSPPHLTLLTKRTDGRIGPCPAP